MSKKVLSFCMALLMLCGTVVIVPQTVSASAYVDVADDAYYAQAVNDLSLYGVLSGFAGYFNPDGTITRAEFAKIASLVAGLEDEVSGSAGNKRFNDVDVTYWANGYINTASSNQLLVGYPDGMFRPEQTINFAEAVTVILRLLGYTSENLGDNWPYAYLTKAEGLGITENLYQDPYTPVSRANVAVMVYRALQLDMNGTSDKLITKLEITESEETVVIATRNEDVSLSANQVRTDLGVYELADSSISVPVLSKVKLMLNKDNEIINFVTVYTPTVQTVTVDTLVENGIAYSSADGSGTLNIKDDTVAYYKGQAQTYGTVKNYIETGSTVNVYYDENGALDYIMLTDAEMTDPVVLRQDVYTDMSTVGVTAEQLDNASVIRDGDISSLEELQTYDVLYYSAPTSTLYAYCDKISGVYEEALPSKASVSSIEISGTELSLETQTAAQKLGAKEGAYQINDKITALLGKDGAIVDVVDLNASDVSSIVILLSTEEVVSEDTDSKGRTETYVNVLTGNGLTMQYKTLKDYSEAIGDVRKVTFDEEGYATFEQISKTKVSGTIDKTNRKVGDHWLTADAKILEIVSVPDGNVGTAEAREIELSDIVATELDSDEVVHAEITGDFQDISLLIVDNISGDKYQYGILVRNNSRATDSPNGQGLGSVSGSYEILSGATSTTYSTNFYTSIGSGTAVGYLAQNGSLSELFALTKVSTSGEVGAIDFSRIRVGSGVYQLADDVQIYEREGVGEYRSVSVNDCVPSEMENVRLYADQPISQGGQVRVIIYG